MTHASRKEISSREIEGEHGLMISSIGETSPLFHEVAPYYEKMRGEEGEESTTT